MFFNGYFIKLIEIRVSSLGSFPLINKYKSLIKLFELRVVVLLLLELFYFSHEWQILFYQENDDIIPYHG